MTFGRGGNTFRTRPAYGEKVLRRESASALLPVKAGWRGSEGGSVDIDLGGKLERLEIDPVKGPQVLTTDGATAWLPFVDAGKTWTELDAVDQKVMAYKAARMNAEVRRLLPELAKRAELRALAEKAAEAERRVKALRQTLAKALLKGDAREIVEARCAVELAKEPKPWTPIDGDKVVKNHGNRAPGMHFGLEFPWNEDLLEEFGPDWLTKAFHAAGSLHESNRVVSLSIEKKIKIDAGNNAGKFLFEVSYEKPSPELDTLLFAKVPYRMTPETRSDRISSSVYKQPMDLHEINTYRLMEAAFPMKTPKFYYGDISNETSNFILITARIPYAEMGMEPGKMQLKPFDVEGPYDKCKDALQLRGPPEDYYTLLMEVAAKIAGLHKAGKMVSEDVLKASLRGVPADPANPAAWGLNPKAPTGEPPATLQSRLNLALKFVTETAKAVFPEYVTTQAWQDKFTNTMMTWSAYSNEIQYWLHSDLSYVSLGHNNLNSDNAYFWRDDKGKLDCGVIDWGGFGEGPLGHKMWWTFNCADFDQFRQHLSRYVDTFISTYCASGGPSLDKELFREHVLISTLPNMMFMVRAVPDCMKMCPLKEWATITDRKDPRIANNVNGKSTLRTTIHVLTNTIRVLEEMGTDRVLDRFIQDVYVRKWNCTPKTHEMIFGK